MARPKTIDLYQVLGPDGIALTISQKYNEWKIGRRVKEDQWKEVRNYIFATDTTTTSNAKLPWKNKTTRPKLCQIRDNLFANYLSALFPNDDWFTWDAGDADAANKDKKLAIEAYMRHVFSDSGFKQVVSQLVCDFIDYGNCFADVDYVAEIYTTGTGVNKVTHKGYVGPKLIRISPLDIVFDITAPSFEESPKITRSLVGLGTLMKLRETRPEWKNVSQEIITRMLENRSAVMTAGQSGLRKEDMDKAAGLTADGFNSLYDYYNSNSVEILEFEGDLYDTNTGTLYQDRVITIIDRLYVVRNEPIKNWFGKSFKRHAGWRLRPDNLMAMGPLDNLVGMQYRIDHLENLKADVFDLIAYPVAKVKGYVEDYVYGPNERIYMEETADVEFMRPDTTALNADMQIRELENTMENMAGAPQQAMGVRTPGEKTAFEVQTLDNAASRIFQSKISAFEEFFLEPLINQMLETSRRNLDFEQVVAVVRDDIGVTEFLGITQKDLTAKGKLVPMGARHFAARAQIIQNLTNLANTGLYQDPDIRNHLSGIKMAEMIQDNLGLARYDLFQPNIRIGEQMESAQMTQEAQAQLQMSAMTPTEGSDPNAQPNGPPPSGGVVPGVQG